MTATKLIVVGGGGHAREVLWLSSEATERFRVVGYLDDWGDAAERIDGTHYLGRIERCVEFLHAHFVVAIGAPRVRRAMVRRLRDSGVERFARLIHRDTSLSNRVRIGDGVQICAGVRITTDVAIGSHAIVNQNCTLAHDCRLGDFVTLAPLVALSGNVRLHDGVEAGTGTVIRQGITMGRGAMAGMGSVVIGNVDEGDLVVGNPARRLRALERFGED